MYATFMSFVNRLSELLPRLAASRSVLLFGSAQIDGHGLATNHATVYAGWTRYAATALFDRTLYPVICELHGNKKDRRPMPLKVSNAPAAFQPANCQLSIDPERHQRLSSLMTSPSRVASAGG